MASFETSLVGADRDAFTALAQLFDSYGIGSLAPKIQEYLVSGYAKDTISLLLADTPEYKQRFAANQARVAKGLPALSPAEYLATEKSYRQIMSAAGLPVGFYDQPEDFRFLLESDLSPQEVQSRVKAAQDFVNNAPAEARAAFGQWYTNGDMVAYALDPTRASSAVERAYQTAAAAGYARQQKLDIAQTRAEDIAKLGLSGDALSQGFSAVASEAPNATKLAQIDNQALTTDDLMRETFLNDAGVAEKRKRLASAERGRFGGSSSTGSGTLARTKSGSV